MLYIFSLCFPHHFVLYIFGLHFPSYYLDFKLPLFSASRMPPFHFLLLFFCVARTLSLFAISDSSTPNPFPYIISSLFHTENIQVAGSELLSPWRVTIKGNATPIRRLEESITEYNRVQSSNRKLRKCYSSAPSIAPRKRIH